VPCFGNNRFADVDVITPVTPPAHAQNSYQATLAIRLDQPRWTINRNIYGQFAEHLGRLIYEGSLGRRKLADPKHARAPQRCARGA
jgi:hypothetical protein